MASKRTKVGQRKHDLTVSRVAKRLENQGCTVKADLPGQPQRNNISGFIPDVHASKRKSKKIRQNEKP